MGTRQSTEQTPVMPAARLRRIASMLGPRSIAACAGVCTAWRHALAGSEARRLLWTPMLARDFGLPSVARDAAGRQWSPLRAYAANCSLRARGATPLLRGVYSFENVFTFDGEHTAPSLNDGAVFVAGHPCAARVCEAPFFSSTGVFVVSRRCVVAAIQGLIDDAQTDDALRDVCVSWSATVEAGPLAGLDDKRRVAVVAVCMALWATAHALYEKTEETTKTLEEMQASTHVHAHLLFAAAQRLSRAWTCSRASRLVADAHRSYTQTLAEVSAMLARAGVSGAPRITAPPAPPALRFNFGEAEHEIAETLRRLTDGVLDGNVAISGA